MDRICHRGQAARRLLDHLTYVMPSFEVAPHHVLICDRIDALLSGELDELYIAMPPRHGKSEIGSIALPAFYLGLHPERQVQHCSYAAALTNTFSRQVRTRVRDEQLYAEVFVVPLDREKQAVNDWRTALGGGMFSVGVHGGISGHGAHLQIIDDAVSEQEAFSLTELENTWNWYVRGPATRLAPGGKKLFIGTRQHKYDLMGRAMAAAKRAGVRWEYLKLEAINTVPDAIRSAPGMALWPAWYPLEVLRAIEAIDSRAFQLVYQQNDDADESSLFKREYFTVRDRVVFQSGVDQRRPVLAFDLALGETEQADYVAWAEGWVDRKNRLHVRNYGRNVMQWPAAKRMIEDFLKSRDYANHDMIFEKRNIETMALQELRAAYPDQAWRLYGVSMAGDKAARAAVVAARGAGGGLFLRDEAECENLIRECVDFPAAPHDDYVDVLSLMAHHFGLHKLLHAEIDRQEIIAKRRAEARIAQAIWRLG